MKIAWAFDPFHTNKDQQVMVRTIMDGVSTTKDLMTAVYVASNAEAELATAFSIPQSKRYSTYPKKMMMEAIRKLGLRKCKAEVLSEESLSLTSIVKRVTDYTKQTKTDLLVVATNNKKTLPRMVFGSFAESIVHLASCDLYVFHQKSKIKKGAPKKILFAHDLTAKGALGLERAVFYAKKWQAQLIIVHVPIPEVGMSAVDFKESTLKKMTKLESTLQKQKVNYQIYLESEIRPTYETILSMADKTGADIIAVAAQSKKLEAFLGGSITRQILRESKLPTLIFKV